jgi:hypothetical protein
MAAYQGDKGRKVFIILQGLLLSTALWLTQACAESYYNRRHHQESNQKYEHLQDSVPAKTTHH